MKKILFIGYNSHQTSLISFLRKKHFVKELEQRHISISDAKNYDLIISFGYKKIIKKKILQKLSRPPINLHISYLPYNRGAHPNFWSFVENTPKGVSIHEINAGIDTGGIIARKKVNFNLTKNLTFKDTYKVLIDEVESLFIEKFEKILNKNYKLLNINGKGTFHKKKELPKNLVSWDAKIRQYLNI